MEFEIESTLNGLDKQKLQAECLDKSYSNMFGLQSTT